MPWRECRLNKASRKNEFSNYQSQTQPSRTREEERRDDEDVIYVKLCHDSPEASSIWYVRTYVLTLRSSAAPGEKEIE